MEPGKDARRVRSRAKRARIHAFDAFSALHFASEQRKRKKETTVLQSTSSCPKLYFKCPTTRSGSICHSRKACREFNGQNETELPSKHLVGNFDHVLEWQITHNSQRCPFRLSRRLLLFATTHFHLESSIALWAEAMQGHISVLQEVPETS